MSEMKIEFFHNSVCSFCYIQSRRLQEILREYPDAEVIHRAFPLNYASEEIKQVLTDEERDVTVKQWQRANRVDEAKRFNVGGLEATMDFIKPRSRNAELAIKAAVQVAGEDIHWALSDAVQKAYFERLNDISDTAILESIVSSFDVDLVEWREAYSNPALEEEILSDFQRAKNYDLDIIPSIVVNGSTIIKGAIRPQLVREKLDQAL